MTDTRYSVFVRSWWKRDPTWPDGRRPHAGPRTYLGRHLSSSDALARSGQYNNTHEPGFLSRKAEVRAEE
jgi:hypothetical protein